MASKISLMNVLKLKPLANVVEQCNGSLQRSTVNLNDTYYGCGYYANKYNARKTYKPPSMTLDYVKAKYNEMGQS